VIKGHINKGQNLYLGPDAKGNFRPVQIVDIRCLMVNVRYAKCGQTCTVYIIDPQNELESYFEDIRRGMVLVESKLSLKAFKEFQVEIRLIPKALDVVITKKHQPVVNTLTTRQICQIISTKELEAKKPELRAKSSINRINQ
jgi:GTPase